MIPDIDSLKESLWEQFVELFEGDDDFRRKMIWKVLAPNYTWLGKHSPDLAENMLYGAFESLYRFDPDGMYFDPALTLENYLEA